MQQLSYFRCFNSNFQGHFAHDISTFQMSHKFISSNKFEVQVQPNLFLQPRSGCRWARPPDRQGVAPRLRDDRRLGSGRRGRAVGEAAAVERGRPGSGAERRVRIGLNYLFGTKKCCHQIRKFHGIHIFVLQLFCNSQRILTFSHTSVKFRENIIKM